MAGWKWRMAGGAIVLGSLACFPQTGRALDWLCRKDDQRPQSQPRDCEFGFYSTAWRIWPEGCKHGPQACEQCRRSGACGPGGCRSDGATPLMPEVAPSYEAIPPHSSLSPGTTYQWTTPIQPGHSPLNPGSAPDSQYGSPNWTQPGHPAGAYPEPIHSSPGGTPIHSEPYRSSGPVFPPDPSQQTFPDQFESGAIQGTGFRTASSAATGMRPQGPQASQARRGQPETWQHSPQYSSGRPAPTWQWNAAGSGHAPAPSQYSQPAQYASAPQTASAQPRAWVVPMPSHYPVPAAAQARPIQQWAANQGQPQWQYQSQPQQQQYRPQMYQQPYQQQPQMPTQLQRPVQNPPQPAMQAMPYGQQHGGVPYGYGATGYGPQAVRSVASPSPAKMVDPAIQQAGWSTSSATSSTGGQISAIVPGYAPLHVSPSGR